MIYAAMALRGSGAGFTELIALEFITIQQPRLLFGFDAFGHHFELQGVRQSNDGGNERKPFRSINQIHHK